jgi:hypothetical protein
VPFASKLGAGIMNRIADILGQITRVLFYLVCIVGGAFLLYAAFNNPVRNTPWAQLTMNDQAGNFFLMTIAGIAFFFPLWLLFNPSKQKQVRDGWAGFGVVTILGIIFFAAKHLPENARNYSSMSATSQPAPLINNQQVDATADMLRAIQAGTYRPLHDQRR